MIVCNAERSESGSESFGFVLEFMIGYVADLFIRIVKKLPYSERLHTADNFYFLPLYNHALYIISASQKRG